MKEQRSKMGGRCPQEENRVQITEYRVQSTEIKGVKEVRGIFPTFPIIPIILTFPKLPKPVPSKQTPCRQSQQLAMVAGWGFGVVGWLFSL